jgi:hypothetical protein
MSWHFIVWSASVSWLVIVLRSLALALEILLMIWSKNYLYRMNIFLRELFFQISWTQPHILWHHRFSTYNLIFTACYLLTLQKLERSVEVDWGTWYLNSLSSQTLTAISNYMDMLVDLSWVFDIGLIVDINAARCQQFRVWLMVEPFWPGPCVVQAVLLTKLSESGYLECLDLKDDGQAQISGLCP